VRSPSPEEDQSRTRSDNEENHCDPSHQKEKLTQADLFRVLSFRSLQIAERREIDSAGLMFLKQMQKDWHADGEASDKKERVQRTH